MTPDGHDFAEELAADQVEQGKAMAIISYLSLPTGLPLFLIPMVQRDNAFALRHAKWAAVSFLAYLASFLAVFVVVMVLSFVTCGMASPLFVLALAAMVFWVPALQGFLDAVNGRAREPVFIGEWTERLFGGLQVIEAATSGDPGGDAPGPEDRG